MPSRAPFQWTNVLKCPIGCPTAGALFISFAPVPQALVSPPLYWCIVSAYVAKYENMSVHGFPHEETDSLSILVHSSWRPAPLNNLLLLVLWPPDDTIMPFSKCIIRLLSAVKELPWGTHNKDLLEAYYHQSYSILKGINKHGQKQHRCHTQNHFIWTNCWCCLQDFSLLVVC